MALSKRKNLLSNRIRLPEQTEKVTEQSETVADTVVVRLVSKRERLICNGVCIQIRMHRHDCWAYGARVLMRLRRLFMVVCQVACQAFSSSLVVDLSPNR